MTRSGSPAEGVALSLPEQNGDAAVVISEASRTLRGRLRPLTWVTLEDVALDAVVDEHGRLMARTSARRVAQHLHVDAGTAAGALRALRDRGLLVYERDHGTAGRFGLSVYVLGPVAGLTVVRPCTARPHMADPSLVRPDVEEPNTAVAPTEEHLSSPSLQCPGQEAFDLGAAS